MKIIPSTALLLCAIASMASAEPIVLAESSPGASQFGPGNVVIGANEDGYLLAGIHTRPVVIPLGPDGAPLVEGTVPIITDLQAWRRGGLVNATSVSEPFWIDGRWVMLVSPDHLLPDRFAIATLRQDGTPIGEARVFGWQRFREGELAWNGRSLLAVASIDRTTSILRDLAIRTIDPSLQSVGAARVIAEDVRHFDVAGTDDGFVVTWNDASTHWLQRFDDAGEPLSEALALPANFMDVMLETSGSSTVVTWIEREGNQRSLRMAPLTPAGPGASSTVAVIPIGGIDYLIESVASGFAIAWQRIDTSGERREISVQRFDANGAPTSAPLPLPDLAGGERLLASASRGEDLLLTYSRPLPGIGEPIWSVIISEQEISEPRFAAVTDGVLQGVDMASTGDGTTWGVWTERSGTGTLAKTARWDANGEQLASATILDIEGILGRFGIASNGADVLVAWQQHMTIFAAPLSSDATLARDPFIVAFDASAPVIQWDGARFVVAYRTTGGIRATFVAPEGVQRDLGLLATLPSPGEWTHYGLQTFDLAIGGEGFVVAAEIREVVFCVQISCPSRLRVAWLSTNGEEPEEFMLGPVGQFPTVAANGESALISWSDVDGVRVMPVDDTGAFGEPGLAFRWPGPLFFAMTWNGSSFLLGASYGTEGWNRIVVLSLDETGREIAPPRGFETTGGGPLVATFTGSDTLFAWSRRAETTNSYAILGELMSRTEANPPRPDTPVITSISTAESGGVVVSWREVEGADEYQVLRVRKDPVDGSPVWFRSIRTTETSATIARVPVRIIALGRGGASEPAEFGTSPRRRGTGRR